MPNLDIFGFILLFIEPFILDDDWSVYEYHLLSKLKRSPILSFQVPSQVC
ncbi:hypothetical protein Sjap_018101 [Stephania japonica]|uniref:Uncharacterized protein n=1 Tax=Stephania japonica TaxID=461633 RepID=A0AAP0I7Z8_9MAGN